MTLRKDVDYKAVGTFWRVVSPEKIGQAVHPPPLTPRARTARARQATCRRRTRRTPPPPSTALTVSGARRLLCMRRARGADARVPRAGMLIVGYSDLQASRCGCFCGGERAPLQPPCAATRPGLASRDHTDRFSLLAPKTRRPSGCWLRRAATRDVPPAGLSLVEDTCPGCSNTLP